MSEPAAPQSDLLTRFAAGVVMIAVACVAIYLGGWPFRLLVAAGGGGDDDRMGRHAPGGPRLDLAGGRIARRAHAHPPRISVSGRGAGSGGDLARAVRPGLDGLRRDRRSGLLYGLISRRLTLGWGFLYIALPSFALLVLSWAWFELVFWLMLVTWATDIFAYFAGRGSAAPSSLRRSAPTRPGPG
jgi:phosphatidate cytidylyltransferase